MHNYFSLCLGVAMYIVISSPQVSRSAQDHEDVSMALLYAILTEPSAAAKVT